MKCTECDKEAEYVVPEDLCEDHWAEWFASGDPEYKKIILRDLEDIRREEGTRS